MLVGQTFHATPLLSVGDNIQSVEEDRTETLSPLTILVLAKLYNLDFWKLKIDMEAGMKTLIVVTHVLIIDQILELSISKLPRKSTEN